MGEEEEKSGGKEKREEEKKEKEEEGGEDREGVHIGILGTPSYVDIMRKNGLTSSKVYYCNILC